MRKTKLVITFGPALMQGDRLTDVLKEADIIRLNASHGDIETRNAALLRVRKVSRELGREIPVFLDLQGPKWRVGALETPVELRVGAVGFFYPPSSPEAAPKDGWAVPLPHPELFESAEPGQKWLLDDGAIIVEVITGSRTRVEAKVEVGGLLKARKGVHPVGGDIKAEPLTEKDRVDIKWGVENHVDLFAQSFVRTRADVQLLKALIAQAGGDQPIISKIEHPQALTNLAEILDESWGVMVARGDLGVELGVQRVPALQKQIITAARMALKPVITATQMLESMIENPFPTRAEASDVANAVWDGTDAVMLSAESATGKYPVEAVRWLASVAAEADEHTSRLGDPLPREIAREMSSRIDVNVAFSASRVAEAIGARWLVVFTEGGGVARLASRLAGNTPVLGVTSDARTARRLSLLRGVTALLIPRFPNTDAMVDGVREILVTHQGLKEGDRVVMTMGLPLWKVGTTDTLKVLTI